MSELKVWSNTIKKNINNQSDNIFKRDYKFFKIDRLERIAERIDEFSVNCESCSDFKTEVENISENIAKSINGSPKDRSQYEKRNENIIRHLKEKHKLIHRDYYASVYSLAGLAGGIILFGSIAFLIDIRYFIFGLLSGFTIGIISGRIFGRRKDKIKESKGLIL